MGNSQNPSKELRINKTPPLNNRGGEMRKVAKTNSLSAFHPLSALPLLVLSHTLPSSLRSTLKMCGLPSESVRIENHLYQLLLNTLKDVLVRDLKSLNFLYQVFFIFEVSAYTTLFQTVVKNILNVWILVSAQNRLNNFYICLIPI